MLGVGRSPNITLSGPEFNKHKIQMMIDTGADLNVIKQEIISPEISIYTDVVYNLKGITDSNLSTMGYIKVKFLSTEIEIHVVETLPIAQDGLLGTTFFKEIGASIDFSKSAVLVEDYILPFDNCKVTIPNRSRNPIPTFPLQASEKRTRSQMTTNTESGNPRPLKQTKEEELLVKESFEIERSISSYEVNRDIQVSVEIPKTHVYRDPPKIIFSSSSIKLIPPKKEKNLESSGIESGRISPLTLKAAGNTVLSPYVLTGRDRRVTRIVNSDPNSDCSFLASFWPKGGARWNACMRDGRARWSQAVTVTTGTASQNLDAGPAQVFFAP